MLPLSAIDEESWFFHSAQSTVLAIPYPSSRAFYQKPGENIQCSDKEIITQANIRKIARGPEDSARQSLQFFQFQKLTCSLLRSYSFKCLSQTKTSEEACTAY